MSERAKIRARRVTGNDQQQQAAVAQGDQARREMALLPYSVRQVTQRSKGRRDRGDRGIAASCGCRRACRRRSLLRRAPTRSTRHSTFVDGEASRVRVGDELNGEATVLDERRTSATADADAEDDE